MARTPRQSDLVSFDWDARAIDHVADRLGAAFEDAYDATGETIVDLIRGLIRSRTGALARSWKWRRFGSVITVTSDSEYAYPSVKGAYIVPVTKKALVFQIAGRTVFAKRVRYSPGAYVGRGRGVRSSKSYLDDAVLAFETEGIRRVEGKLAEKLRRIA